jgi:arsenite-transporting ATPase
VLPADVRDGFFTAWRATQAEVLREMDTYFAPVPVRHVPLFNDEVLGVARLAELARQLYADGDDPSAVHRTERPYAFTKRDDGRYEVRLVLPFAARGEIELFKKGDELVVEIGTLRRHIGLPTSMTALHPARARLVEGVLTIELEPPP